MPNQHPITPPPELVQQWCLHSNKHETADQFWRHIATQAAQWGSDQELEACCEWLDRRLFGRDEIAELRADRRPKPPSLKERALQAWAAVEAGTDDQAAMTVIRRALEALDD